MMNDRARLWSKRKSAPFADPRDEERALREMRKSIDHSFNFNVVLLLLRVDVRRPNTNLGADVLNLRLQVQPENAHH